MVLSIIAKRGTLIRFLPPEISDSSTYMLDILEKMDQLYDSSSSWQEGYRLSQLKQQLICFISERLQNNKKFLYKLLEKISYFACINEDILEDKEFAYQAFPNGASELLCEINEELRDDADFMLAKLNGNDSYFRCASERLKDNEDFILEFLDNIKKANAFDLIPHS